MTEKTFDLVIIGGGCAGMAAAIAAYDSGLRDIIIIERSPLAGGVLRQCIHNGFGIQQFERDLTGVEYADAFLNEVNKRQITLMTETIVLEITPDRSVLACGSGEMMLIRAGAVILATGCRERPRGALLIPGSRPAGVMTAGCAQRYLNREGYLVGKKIVILGSGDIGLIMARQFVLEGAEVSAVCEIMPYSSGLTRNIVQCIEDYDIPLFFNTTVTRIIGDKRVEAVTIAEVDKDRRPVSGTERRIDCDALILSVGLIPENELAIQAGLAMDKATGGIVADNTLQSDTEGIFACGNALHVHDLADFAAAEGALAGRCAADYVRNGRSPKGQVLKTEAGFGVRGLVPQRIRLPLDEAVRIQFRPASRYTNCRVVIRSGDRVIASLKKPILTPGEMFIREIRAADIDGDIHVEVVL